MKKSTLYLVSVLGFWGAYTLYLVLSGTKHTGTDVFIFKEAGVNLALKGKFVVSNLPFMPANEEITFYFYPPLYPFLYGIWTKITGFGYSQGILFDCLVRLVRTFLLFSFLWKYLKSSSKSTSVFFSVLFLALSFVTSDTDRPDDLASVFGLLSWHFLLKNEKKSFLLSGLFLGLAAGTSATAGAFFALGIAAYLWPWGKNIKPLLSVGSLSAVVFASVLAPIFWGNPELYKLFSRQASLSNFAQFQEFKGWPRLGEFLINWVLRYWECLMQAPSTSSAAIGLLVASVIAYPTIVENAFLRLFFFPGLAMFFLVGVVWILQPYYLWFSALSLFVAASLSYFQKTKHSKIILALIFISVLPKSYEEMKYFIISLQVPSMETVQAISDKLESTIPKGVRVAVSPDQFYTLDRSYLVSNVSHVCMHVEDTDFIYMARSTDSKQQTPIPHICLSRAACFEVLENTTQNRHLSFLGKELPYFVRTSGGTLYKNTRCHGVQIPWNIKAEDWLRENSK